MCKKIDINEDMMDIVMEFAMISCFSCVFPLVPFLCIGINCFRMYTIKRELQEYRRTLPKIQVGIGEVEFILDGVSALSAVVVNAIFFYSSAAALETFVKIDKPT